MRDIIVPPRKKGAKAENPCYIIHSKAHSDNKKKYYEPGRRKKNDINMRKWQFFSRKKGKRRKNRRVNTKKANNLFVAHIFYFERGRETVRKKRKTHTR